jgi:ADP-heptose:LPS heptosyltransferase
MNMAVTACRHFNGYKPCALNASCDNSCAKKDIPQVSILLVHLGALGAVVRSTSLLKAIKRKHPSSMITWVTDAPAHLLLKNHPAIDRVLTTKEEDLVQLSALEFEIGYVIDKSLKAVGIAKRTQIDQIYGFTADPKNGAIIPATKAAEELWSLGLDNHKKFFVNKKPETQLMIEALELGTYQRDDYWLPLSNQESQNREQKRNVWLGRNATQAAAPKKVILGINTGCANVIAAKKLTVEFQRQIIEQVQQKLSHVQIVLLGGPEDTERNRLIADGLDVISSSTDKGLRDGLESVAACDVVLTGDSLGMHMAISQQKRVIAWFGPTCAHEIELYGRGEAILTKSPCSPCWKRSCDKAVMCYDQVSLEELVHAIKFHTAESYSSDSLLGGSASLDSTP